MNQDSNTAINDLSFSLLWPKGRKIKYSPVDRTAQKDLDMDRLISTLACDTRHATSLSQLFDRLILDSDTINYRLDILEDLLASPTLAEAIKSILPVIIQLRYYNMRQLEDEKKIFQEVLWRLRELEHYLECINRLNEAFSRQISQPRSKGLLQLKAMVNQAVNDESFGKLKEKLPSMLEKISHLKSITIGVNLNNGLLPVEAALISLNDESFVDKSLFNSIIKKDEWTGLAPLHRAPGDEYSSEPLMTPLLADIYKIMEKTAKPLSAALEEFIHINSKLLIKFHEEFLFYIGAFDLISGLRKQGMAFCRPDIQEADIRLTEIKGLYNINLAILEAEKMDPALLPLNQRIVGNDLNMNDHGRILILTGPNRGGKTTFMQAAGLAQIMAQQGLFVPGECASISLVDRILTHYPALEKLELGTGRFGEEAGRLKLLFQAASRHSLVLLNESLSSTSMGEALFLAKDLLCVLRQIGLRAMFATHLHDLALSADNVNASCPGDSKILSLVSAIEEIRDKDKLVIKRTFTIKPGPPLGQSYALELAESYGISKAQLLRDINNTRNNFST
ncbi:MAG: hypothetical protein JXR70_05515 [Spirochaetales bacterium]|nr:hypothetical protein [Spirochaetales bacterium]